MQSTARRSERIDYRVSVALFEDRADDKPIIGRSHNVSEGGMLVEAPLAACAGEPLRCELSLDGRRTCLDGHVVWSTAADLNGEQRIGIRFEPLDDQVGGVLRHVIRSAREGYQPMQLRFDDVPEPVTARGSLSEIGLVLSAPLAILDRGREVGFSYEDGRGPFKGKVGDVTVSEEDGERRLEITLEVEPRERRRIERHTVHGYQLEAPTRRSSDPSLRPPRARQLTTPVWRVGNGLEDEYDAEEAAASEEPRDEMQERRRRLGWLAVLLALVLGAAVGAVAAGASF